MAVDAVTTFGVYSPDYETWSSWGPTEVGCDYSIIEADTGREARWTFVREWRRKPGSWVADNLADGHHPLKGIKVERLDIDEVAR